MRLVLFDLNVVKHRCLIVLSLSRLFASMALL
jgi:hypothetical protein